MWPVMNKATDKNEVLLTRKQVADELGYRTGHSVRNLEKRGLLTALRINSRVLRYRKSDLVKLLKEAES